MNNRILSFVLIVLGTLALLIGAGGVVAQSPQPSNSNLPTSSIENQPDPILFPPTKLTYQGRLTTNSGAAVNSSVSMVFRIYNNAGNLLWTSAVRNVIPSNGLFTVVLGESPDTSLLHVTLSNAASIGVTVGSDLEMTPRQPLNTVVGHSAASAGVIGGSDTGIGVYGKSSSGTGIYGYSNTGVGLSANSNGGGIVNAAIVANNTLTTTGMAGYFSNHSSNSTIQIGNAGNGKAGEFLNNGSNPTGSFRNDGTGSVLNLYNGSGPFLNSYDQLMDDVSGEK